MYICSLSAAVKLLVHFGSYYSTINLWMILFVSRWIEAMESLPSLLVPGLVHIVDSIDHKGSLTL